MHVKFDKFDCYDVPGITLCNPGSVYNNGNLSRSIGVIPFTSDEELIINFGSTSELNFRMTPPSDNNSENSDELRYSMSVYHRLQNRRLLFVDGFGYFVINDVDEQFEGGITFKDISASSCEVELQNKGLTYIEDGTYKFIDLLEKIVATVPRWVIGHVDDKILELYRTFEDVDTSVDVLSFFREDMQDAYECIFQFDIINRVINVYDQSSYIVPTSIYLTCDDIIESMGVSESSDDLFTALSIHGEDEISISAINPLGGSTIYNFDYYIGWMSDNLRKKVNEWTSSVESSIDEYFDLNLRYYECSSAKSTCSYEISRLNIELETYVKCRENIIAESSSDKVEEYNNVLDANGSEKIDITSSIEEIIAEIDSRILETQEKIEDEEKKMSSATEDMADIKETLSEIHNSISFESFFTQDEYDELFDYIYEGSYTDEHIILTDSMTMKEKLEQMRELYNKSVRKLKIASVPSREFNVDTGEFIFAKKFEAWSSQIEPGCIIKVEMIDKTVVDLFLTSMQINWYDQTISLTFGNQFIKNDPQSLFNDVLGDIDKSANSIEYIKTVLYPIEHGRLDEIEASIKGSNTLNYSDGISSANGEIRIDASGYTGKKQAAGVYSRSKSDNSKSSFVDEQLKIAGNTVVFTDDAWSTCKTALGYVVLQDLSIKYGLNAQSIVGTMILDERLKITDKDGNSLFSIIDNEISLKIKDKTDQINLKIDGVESELSSRLLRLADDVASNQKSIDEIKTLIGPIDDGKTVSQMISDINVIYSDLQLRVEENTTAISELRNLISGT